MVVTQEGLQGLVNRVVRGRYPRYNYEGIPSRTEVRTFLVEAVRVMEAEPLSTETHVLNPLLKRGTVLLSGWDFDRGAQRSFYLESLTDLEVMPAGFEPTPKPLAIAIFSADSRKELRRIDVPDPRVSACHWHKQLSPDEFARSA